MHRLINVLNEGIAFTVFLRVTKRDPSLQGARKKLEDNKEQTAQNHAIVQRLLRIKEELLEIRKELDRLPDTDIVAG